MGMTKKMEKEKSALSLLQPSPLHSQHQMSQSWTPAGLILPLKPPRHLYM